MYLASDEAAMITGTTLVIDVARSPDRRSMVRLAG
jgi:hypothetical protein